MRFSLRSLLALLLVVSAVFATVSIKLNQDARRRIALTTLKDLGVSCSGTFSNLDELHLKVLSPDFDGDDLLSFIDCVKT